MDILLGYGLSGIVIIGIAVLLYLVIPSFVKNENIAKYKNIVLIAIDLVKSIEQEFAAQAPKPDGMSDEDYQKLKDDFNAKKKATCIENIKNVCIQYKLAVPSDAILGTIVEYAVWAMNQIKA